MPAERIYSTFKLPRHYPPDRTVLEDISMSFYPGANIGVIGPNGAGKSSLRRILAGLDDGFTGSTHPAGPPGGNRLSISQSAMSHVGNGPR